jgi:deoxyribodipyrimidine photo-lyase
MRVHQKLDRRSEHERSSECAAAPVIVWFRNDLRLSDNPALHRAAASGRPILCIYIGQQPDKMRAEGGASRWWLHHALSSLRSALVKHGADLKLFEGDAETLLPEIAALAKAGLVVWNRRYGQAERSEDQAIKTALKQAGHGAESFNSHLLYEPWEVRTKAGGAMRVYSPFWRAARRLRDPAPPLRAPKRLLGHEPGDSVAQHRSSRTLDELGLLPQGPDWAKGLACRWKPGEAEAAKRLDEFLGQELAGYAENRNLPGRASTSRLSPYLKSGEIGIRQVWATAMHGAASGKNAGSGRDLDTFLAELGWREFSYHLLFHLPNLGSSNIQAKFDRFPWLRPRLQLRAWQQGLTGYPMVDAGMRELWQTGWMHNRVRMLVASFLVKHLLIDWREGEAWFWDTLVDADPANNAASWQWVAGSGADAAPYFRIFNPVSQGLKFDADGAYVRRFVPELVRLPDRYLHAPWTAPASVLDAAGIALGHDYPEPIVAHEAARARALEAFKSIGDSRS